MSKIKLESFIEGKVKENDEVKYIEPSSILTKDRFDIAYKLLFLDSIDDNKKYKSELYCEHIKLITLGKFSEFGSETKNTLDAFVGEFLELYNSIIEGGFDEGVSVVPLSAEDKSIANGSHRLSIALKLGKKIPCISTNSLPQGFTPNFFKKRGASENFINIGINRFIKELDSVYIAIIWPSSGKSGANYSKELFSDIIDSKSLDLNLNGLKNLVAHAYSKENWIGTFESNFQTALNKAIPCFKENTPTRVYLFQDKSHDNVLQLKERFRDFCKLDKHSIHVTDTTNEVLNLASLIWQCNSDFLLNNASPYNAPSLYENFKKIPKRNDLMVGSSIMNLFGLRDSYDLDLIRFDSNNYMIDSSTLIEYKKFLNIDDPYQFFSSPSNRTFFQGIYFLEFSLLKKFKDHRSEDKDINDVILMNDLLRGRKSSSLVKLKTFIFYYQQKCLHIVIYFLFKTRLYKPVRFIYRLIKRVVNK
jgi:hypothetical protein